MDPIGACVNCNNSLSGAALYGNLAGRAAGLCTSMALMEAAVVGNGAYYAGNAAYQGSKYVYNKVLQGAGRSLYNRVMGDSIQGLGREVMAQNRAALTESKMVESNFKMVDLGVRKNLVNYKINYIPKCPATGKPLALPRNKDGVNIPSSNSPHTQIGWRFGRKSSYPQTRQWGANRKEIKTTDWTDHGRPEFHSNPHDHLFIPNSTGGSLERGDPMPFQIFE